LSLYPGSHVLKFKLRRLFESEILEFKGAFLQRPSRSQAALKF